jgi:hypothetical protein
MGFNPCSSRHSSSRTERRIHLLHFLLNGFRRDSLPLLSEAGGMFWPSGRGSDQKCDYLLSPFLQPGRQTRADAIIYVGGKRCRSAFDPCQRIDSAGALSFLS